MNLKDIRYITCRRRGERGSKNIFLVELEEDDQFESEEEEDMEDRNATKKNDP